MAINVAYFVMLLMFVMFMAWFTIHMDIHIFIGHKHAYIFINTLDWIYYYSYVFFFSVFDGIVLCQNGGEFLILANTQKRQKIQEDDDSNVFERVEVGSCFDELIWWELCDDWLWITARDINMHDHLNLWEFLFMRWFPYLLRDVPTYGLRVHVFCRSCF